MRDTRKRGQIELFQTGHKGDLNGFQRLTAAGVVGAVVFQRDMLRVTHFQPFKQLVQR